MMTGSRRRLGQALLLAAVLVGSGTRGLCFMPAAAAGSLGSHDCCKPGLTSAPPPCCMEGRMDEAPAVRLVTQWVPAVNLTPTACLHSVGSSPLGRSTSMAPNSFHSPPAEL